MLRRLQQADAAIQASLYEESAAYISREIPIEEGGFIDRVVVREQPPLPRPAGVIPLVDLSDQDTIPYEPPVVDLTNDQDELLEPLVQIGRAHV